MFYRAAFLLVALENERHPVRIGGYDYTTQALAEAKCQQKGWQRLCSKDEVSGWANCAHGWMSDYQGYWYDRTAQGCGTGIGWRDGSSLNALGAYCCEMAPMISRAFVTASLNSIVSTLVD